MTVKDMRIGYEAPQAEVMYLQIEECVLSAPQKGGGETLSDELEAGF